MRAILLTAMLALVLLPAASARPPGVDDLPTLDDVCYRDPCAGYGVSGTGTENNAYACEWVDYSGACVAVHVGTDGVMVHTGVGITVCHYGVQNGNVVYQCYY